MPETASLKGKRQILKKVIERTKNRFNVSVAEVGYNDEWQRGEIALASVGNDGHFVNSTLDKIINFIEEMQVAEIMDTDIEIMSL